MPSSHCCASSKKSEVTWRRWSQPAAVTSISHHEVFTVLQWWTSRTKLAVQLECVMQWWKTVCAASCRIISFDSTVFCTEASKMSQSIRRSWCWPCSKNFQYSFFHNSHRTVADSSDSFWLSFVDLCEPLVHFCSNINRVHTNASSVWFQVKCCIFSCSFVFLNPNSRSPVGHVQSGKCPACFMSKTWSPVCWGALLCLLCFCGVDHVNESSHLDG